MSSTFSNEPNLPRLGLVESHSHTHLNPHLTNPSLAQALLENQSLKEQIAAQTQLMHLLTHQLATPLTSLSGSVQLLAEPSLKPEERQEFLQVVQQQVQRLKNLLADLVALQDLETGTIDTQTVGFCLLELVDEVVEGFRPHPIGFHFGPDLPPVWGDPWQTSQVLVNLLSNAIKYSPAGTAIEIGATLLPTGWVEIWVQDHGLGIPEADQPHLFERFYRVKHRDRQDIDGTGLGLSICKLLVEKQGGQMGFQSAHGHGSRFYFTLPTVQLPSH